MVLKTTAFSLAINSCRNVARALQLGGGGDVGLNLPEFTCLVGCSIVNDHYLSKNLKAMVFGYLQEVRPGR